MKILLAAASLVFAAFTAQAQDSATHGDWSFNVWGELNSNKISFSGGSWDRELGFGLGLAAITNIKDAINFRSGAGFITRNGTGPNSTEINFRYIQIPATVMLNFTQGTGVFVGGNFDFLVDKASKPSGGVKANFLAVQAVAGLRFDVTPDIPVELGVEYGLSEMGASKTKLDSGYFGRLGYRF